MLSYMYSRVSVHPPVRSHSIAHFNNNCIRAAFSRADNITSLDVCVYAARAFIVIAGYNFHVITWNLFTARFLLQMYVFRFFWCVCVHSEHISARARTHDLMQWEQFRAQHFLTVTIVQKHKQKHKQTKQHITHISLCFLGLCIFALFCFCYLVERL